MKLTHQVENLPKNSQMIEGNTVGGGRVDLGIVEQDMGDGMQCSNHPNRSNPGGICAFCLQEKLRKLVSSSSPLPIHGSTSSSASPSFRSDTANISSAGFASNVVHTSSSSNHLSLSLSVVPTSSNGGPYQEYYTRRARIPFLLAKKKKVMATATSCHQHLAADVVFKRSKSTATPRRGGGHYIDDAEDFSLSKRSGFWSFLYLSTSKPHSGSSGKMDKDKLSSSSSTSSSTAMSVAAAAKEKSLGSSSMSKKGGIVVVEEDDSPSSQTNNASALSFERRVSRSRSVGCGSRSFSGDFFERISTGFGDCALRRVESQKEGKPKAFGSSAMKEQVKCGGIFGGFVMTSSSSSSSSSSYWVSSSAEEVSGKAGGHLVHGRSRSWGWAFASPMRAFSSKPSSKEGRRDTVMRETSTKNVSTPISLQFLLY